MSCSLNGKNSVQWMYDYTKGLVETRITTARFTNDFICMYIAAPVTTRKT
ncbi:MAG TPA: hypothetical protein VM101_04775 [Flavitalea sp.]|nr:hypothetical protein [Flavitalea sp.]